MVIPTSRNAWSQELMCKKYGFDKLYSKELCPIKADDEWLNDKNLFEYATITDQNLKPPFISFILTSSMHTPYIKSYEKYDICYPDNFSEELKHYLDNVHYMDKYLGIYLNSLKKQPWYKNTTIVITADHKPNTTKLNAPDKSLFLSLPLFILSPNNLYSGANETEQIAQTSLFPSILSMYHIDSEWKGVGQSIFMSDSIRNTPFEKERAKKQQLISNYILNEKYLK